jgi:hypothetical protein
MKRTIIALAALLAAPALAQTPAAPPSDTVTTIMAKGMKIAVADMEFDLVFKPDGTYADPSGMGGKYRVDGKKLCMTPDALGTELCNDYPDGKKTGDSFELASDFGPLTVTMK